MTPSCFNCIYHKDMDCICKNPESFWHGKIRLAMHKCSLWEFEKEYEPKREDLKQWGRKARR